MRRKAWLKNSRWYSIDIRPFPKSWGMAKLLGKTLEEDPALWDSHTVATLIPQLKEAKLNITSRSIICDGRPG